MERPAKRALSWTWVAIILLLIAGAFRKEGGMLLTVMLGGFVFSHLWKGVRKGAGASAGTSAGRISWRWALLLVIGFACAFVAGGHGVAPIGLFLTWGWGTFPAPILLGWLAVAGLGLSPWMPTAFARPLACAGAVLALASWSILQALSDEPLAALPLSLPFLGCLALFASHLWRLRRPEPAANAPMG